MVDKVINEYVKNDLVVKQTDYFRMENGIAPYMYI